MRSVTIWFGLLAFLALAGDALAQTKESPPAQNFDQIGTLHTGVMAIGGETTGTTLETNAGTYELTGNADFAKKAEALDGQKVHVVGTLTIKPGVEIKQRKIVAVDTIEAVKDKQANP